jgi:lysophospholipase L1-like esterase
MKKCLIFLLLLVFALNTFAQSKPPYYADVQTIKGYDKMFKPPVHPVLFVGSSSIRKWDDLQLAFGSYNVLNRGIGGAVISDIKYYLKDLVFGYEPRQIVIYVGENDVVVPNETADTIFNRTVNLYNSIRVKLPDVPIVYIAMKPSPSRDQFREKTMTANDLIRKFLATQKNVVFVDVFALMLKDGHSRPELFVSDMLHMNQQGYDIWNKAVKPYLLKYEK